MTMTLRANNLDEVLTTLDQIVATSITKADPVGMFAALYRAVTLRVKAGIDAGDFEDPARMVALDTHFANRYFDAVQQWWAGKRHPQCWWVAFGAMSERNVTIVQQLLLGINAHINLDLSVSLATIAKDPIELAAMENDFARAGVILTALLDEAQASIARFSPALRLLDIMLLDVDEGLAHFSMTRARKAAWEGAEALLALSTAEWPKLIARRDRDAASLAHLIKAPGGLIGLGLRLVGRLESTDTAAVVAELARLR